MMSSILLQSCQSYWNLVKKKMSDLMSLNFGNFLKSFWRNWPKLPSLALGHWTLIFLANLNPYKGHSIKFTCLFLPEICFLSLSNLRLLQRIEQFCWFQPNWFKITHLKKRFWDIFNKKSTRFYHYMFKTIINFRINKEKPNLDTSNS